MNSWKEIAAYLERSVSTVQRWEREEQLPVHRLVHAKAGTVYALTSELDEWFASRDASARGEPEHASPEQAPSPGPAAGPHLVPPAAAAPAPLGRRVWWIGGAAVVAIAALVIGPRVIRRSEAPSAAPASMAAKASVPAATGVTSMAILPLASQSAETSAFADGLTEELITEMGRQATLGKLINPRSVRRYRDATQSPSAIARELGVDALLTGRVFRSGAHVRITAQLVGPHDDRILWAGTFDESVEDILVLQHELVADVVGALNLRLRPDSTDPAHRVDPEAYDLYLKGLAAFDAYTTKSLKESPELLRRAVERDPTFARAHAVRALAIAHAGYIGSFVEPSRPARAEADRAIALDPSIGEAHAARAYVLGLYEWKWKEAGDEHRRAIALAPNSSMIRTGYAHYLGMIGRFDASLSQAHRAVDLDPWSDLAGGEVYWATFHASRFRDMCEKQDAGTGEDTLHQIANWLDRYCEAHLGQVARVCATGANDSLCGYAHALAGHDSEARRVFTATCDRPALHGGGPDGWNYDEGCQQLAAALGDREPLLRFVERLVGAHANEAAFLRGAKYYDTLKGEPRFHAALRRMGLDDDQVAGY